MSKMKCSSSTLSPPSMSSSEVQAYTENKIFRKCCCYSLNLWNCPSEVRDLGSGRSILTFCDAGMIPKQAQIVLGIHEGLFSTFFCHTRNPLSTAISFHLVEQMGRMCFNKKKKIIIKCLFSEDLISSTKIH